MSKTDTRQSWNIATRNHNAHKGDQAAFLRGGGSTLFGEEIGLLGGLDGLRVAHLQCNAGQDTLSLLTLGTPAALVGIDLSDEAIAFATRLGAETGLPARFVRDDVLRWLAETPERFDVVFASYGTLGWLSDLNAYFRGVCRVLVPGGRFVLIDFHPVAWSVNGDLRLAGDDYFQTAPFIAPVGDYVARAGTGLLAVDDAREPLANEVPAASWQHTLGAQVTAAVRAGLRIDALTEYPHANGCQVVDALVRDAEPATRRWVWPPGTAKIPLMYSLVAVRPELASGDEQLPTNPPR